MSEASDLELEQEAREILRSARDPAPAPEGVKARALARLIAVLPPGGGDPGGAPPPPKGGPAPAPGASGSAVARALGARVPAWSLAVSFIAGGAIAAATLRPVPARRTEPVVAAVPVVSSTPTPLVAASGAAPPTGASAAADAPVAPAASPSPASGASRSVSSARPGDGSLDEERALLDVARTALGRGDGDNALRATEAHVRKYPRGVLVEEREAMTIQALRLLHRDADARARLERFRGRFPTSLIRPALEADDAGLDAPHAPGAGGDTK